MSTTPAVLVLDDGELEHVTALLRGMGLEVQRLTGGEIGSSVPAPERLLVSSGRRTLNEMPTVVSSTEDASPFLWVCLHSQDFLPMRERLSGMGVHYLLQSALDEDSLRRFLSGLLRTGAEQRRGERLPLGGELSYAAGGPVRRGYLVEISLDGCRFHAAEPLDVGASVRVTLPPSLGGGEDLELTGSVLRAPVPDLRGGDEVFETALGFAGLSDEARAELEAIVHGERIGTRITPLAAVPAPAARGSAQTPSPEVIDPSAVDLDPGAPPDSERRETPRQPYGRAVYVLGSSSDSVLGHDLSHTGVRLSGCAELVAGARVTVALHGAAREEPVVVEARVERADGSGDAGLAFEALTDSQHAAITRILDASPELAALGGPDEEPRPVVLTEVREAAGA